MSKWVIGVLALSLGCSSVDELESHSGTPGGKADGAGTEWLADSREYKVLLDPGLFVGVEYDAVLELFDELEVATDIADLELEGDDPELDKERVVSFLDVPGSCDLRALGLVVRERVSVSSGKRKLTLKHRSSSYYEIASVDLEPEGDAKEKFEEDIVPPYSIKYSKSATLKLEDEQVENIGDVRALFDVLSDVAAPHSPLATVGDVYVDERVYRLGEVDLGESVAEFSLTLWRLDQPGGTPDIAELSFSYDREGDAFSGKVVNRGHRLFESMSLLSGVLEAGTKTGLVYDASSEFCQP